MDSIADLLKSKKPDEPPQLKAIKAYVLEKHNSESKTSISAQGYTLTVPSASLASTLHMESPLITEQCNLDKKLFIRIGHF